MNEMTQLPVTEVAHACACGCADEELPELDARAIPHAIRHVGPRESPAQLEGQEEDWLEAVLEVDGRVARGRDAGEVFRERDLTVEHRGHRPAGDRRVLGQPLPDGQLHQQRLVDRRGIRAPRRPVAGKRTAGQLHGQAGKRQHRGRQVHAAGQAASGRPRAVFHLCQHIGQGGAAHRIHRAGPGLALQRAHRALQRGAVNEGAGPQAAQIVVGFGPAGGGRDLVAALGQQAHRH